MDDHVRRNRDTIAERAKELDPEALEEKRLIELDARTQISRNLVADSILRELALSASLFLFPFQLCSFLFAQGLDIDSGSVPSGAEEVQEVFPDVDDDDGVDELAEFEAWKLRELMRIKRDTEAKYA